MSKFNIKRAIDNIRSGTNVYTPLVEVIVNAVQAIEAVEKSDGLVLVNIDRSPQIELDFNDPNTTTTGSKPKINGFTITDNGEGFTKENREAFDTLYTDRKIREGGKGFGRFTCLKYFKDVLIESVFFEDGKFQHRKFKMGRKTDIIEGERISDSAEKNTGSIVKLATPTTNMQEKSVNALARTLVEKLLPFFISDKPCPQIKLVDGDESVLLNHCLDSPDPLIQEIKPCQNRFSLGQSEPKDFSARVFRIYSPKSSSSNISLVAHRREVTTTTLHKYIPEFLEGFYDVEKQRNFIVKVYVFGDYLDDNVSLERGDFLIPDKPDPYHEVALLDIALEASQFAQATVDGDVVQRREHKLERVESYVRHEAPWYTNVLKDADLSDFPCNPSDDQIDARLHQEKYHQERKAKEDVNKLLDSKSDDLTKDAAEVVGRISSSSRDELVHYVALRRRILDIFEKSLSVQEDGGYSSEGAVHDIIFNRKSDTDSTPFEEHNLWIIDERLNFTEYLASDIPLNGAKSGRPDLLAFDQRIGFRGDNEPSNPVTIFEFKKPQRDDFVNPSSKEDPVQQIVRYVIEIKEGRIRTPKGRKILIAQNTPFYGYVVCDLTSKVCTWLENEKNFKPMADRLGYFFWHESLNLYIEVLSWDKVLRDANMRNKIFFHKLGIC